MTVSGTEGYGEEAEALLKRYEGVRFAAHHRQALHLIPADPSAVLDIGSGTGRDAAGFAAMGHQVVAVEPTAALRIPAMALHPSPLIEWLDDSLPALTRVLARAEKYDVVMLTAVWMHLDRQQREVAMPNVAALRRPGGVIIMSLRHGPVPRGRRMFEVSPEETVELAALQGLRPVLNLHRPSVQHQPGVTWSVLAFR